jgi:hypothetical protein
VRRIITLCPSRGRPKNVERLIEAYTDTATSDDRLAVIVDDDDPELPRYDALIETYEKRMPGWGLIVQNPRNLSQSLNHWAPRLATRDDDVIGFMGDDHVPRTNGWTDRVRNALGDRAGVVYGDDLFQRANLPTAVFITADVVRELGFFCPPAQRHLYLDNFWLELGRGLGSLHYLADVVIEHVHPAAKKAPLDEHYDRVNAPELWRHDEDAWKAYVQSGRFRSDVDRVRTAVSL